MAFKSVDDADALPETDEEKAALEQKAEESKPVLDFLKETLATPSRRPGCPKS